MPLLHQRTTSARAGVMHLLDWMHHSYYALAPAGTVRCQRCEQPTPLRVTEDAWSQGEQLHYTVATTCSACGHRDRMWLSGVVLALPAGRQFWQEHGRVRLLRERPVEDGGSSAVIGLEAVASAARFEIVVSLPTLTVIGIHGAHGHGSDLVRRSPPGGIVQSSAGDATHAFG
jgi:hypothetical protein